METSLCTGVQQAQKRYKSSYEKWKLGFHVFFVPCCILLQIFLWGMETPTTWTRHLPARQLQIFLWGMETCLISLIPASIAALQIFLWGMETKFRQNCGLAPTRLQIFLWGMETRGKLMASLVVLCVTNLPMRNGNFTYTRPEVTSIPLQIFLWGMETTVRVHLYLCLLRYKSSYEEWKLLVMSAAASALVVTNLPMRNGNLHPKSRCLYHDLQLQIFLWGMETHCGNNSNRRRLNVTNLPMRNENMNLTCPSQKGPSGYKSFLWRMQTRLRQESFEEAEREAK